jgi:transposase-like protein
MVGHEFFHGATQYLAPDWASNEVFLKINRRVHYLWRAVDQDGDVLEYPGPKSPR